MADDFITELEEDIREERLFDLWHKYGNFIIGIALIIVVGTAGYTLWNYVQKRTQLAHYATFSKALSLVKEGKTEDALKVFDELKNGKDGYAKLSQLYIASLVTDCTPVYEEFARKNAGDPGLGNLAKLLGASRNLKDKATEATLKTLASPHNAWASLSFELLGLAALQKGESQQAVENYLEGLKQPVVTLSEQQRLSLMLAQIESANP